MSGRPLTVEVWELRVEPKVRMLSECLIGRGDDAVSDDYAQYLGNHSG